MPGKHATDHQVRRYMDSRKDGYSQAAAAARAGFSERTGRRIEANPVLPSQQGRARRYIVRGRIPSSRSGATNWCRKIGLRRNLPFGGGPGTRVFFGFPKRASG